MQHVISQESTTGLQITNVFTTLNALVWVSVIAAKLLIERPRASSVAGSV